METIEIALKLFHNGNLCVVKSIHYEKSIVELFDTYTGSTLLIVVDGLSIIPK